MLMLLLTPSRCRMMCLVALIPVCFRLSSAPADLSSGFEGYRGPIFGITLERHRTRPVFRLIEDAASGNSDSATITLTEGTLEHCEDELATILQSRYRLAPPNLPFPTLGGKQFWADCFIHCGWRIQKNVYTGHHRLLDSDDRRQAWGSYDTCRLFFETERARQHLRPRSSHLVILVHGLFRSKDSWKDLEQAIEGAGFETAVINYPSSRASIREHADQLHQVLNTLEEVETLSFVTHSLGGIVTREVLGRKGDWRDRIKLGRLIMLGPPNRGSLVAEVLQDWIPYKILAGRSGQELTPENTADIPLPPCEFGIIAGGTGRDVGLNPLLPGDNDGTVLVDNARLPGEKDFLIVRTLHSFLMDDEVAIEATVRFLRTGAFK